MREKTRIFSRAPQIAGVITRLETINKVLSLSQDDRKFDFVEVRLDLIGIFDNWCDKLKALEDAGVKVLLTIRAVSEGGRWKNTPALKRSSFYSEAIKKKCLSLIDVEIREEDFDEIANFAKTNGILVIGSFHDFKKTPPIEELNGIIKQGFSYGADIVKIATMIQDNADINILTSLLKEAKNNLCVIGMGEAGTETRIKFPLAGSVIAYGYLDNASAPGQYSAEELYRLLR